MRNIFIYILLLSSALCGSAQNHPTDYFQAPLDIPLILSGTFGELRSNHFHAGIDIKTQGASGHKVYAIAEGYVSRIKVSPWGYGKALYITHPNGYTSVYAHLSKYYGNIEEYVKTAQYHKESFAIELFLQKEELVVKKGDLVAFSGNSGSSAAPHLHFELRTSKNEFPQNGLHFGFNIVDDIEPIIREIKVQPRGEKSQVNQQELGKFFKPSKKGNIYKVEKPILVHGKVSVGIYTHDLLNGANNKNGVYSVNLNIDGNQIYFHEMDEFGFHETRYINSHIDYAEKQLSRKRIHSCYLELNNPLSIYENVENNGVIEVDSIHQGKFTVKDVYGNTSELHFILEATEYLPITNPKTSTPIVATFPYQEANIYKNEGIEIHIPKKALYDTLKFQYSISSETSPNCYAPIHHVHNEKTAIHKSYAISIENTVDSTLKSKAFIAQINKNGNLTYRGGKWVNNKLTTKLKSFGRFSVAVDTLAPTIKGLNIYPGKTMTSSALRITIKDDISGIKSYRGEIDGKWILMEFDPKRARLTHYFEKELSKGKHTFTLVVEDERGNISNYKADFLY
mgnify:CR=1 FL=1